MLNHVSIMGRFTAEPELRKTAEGTSNVRFTLAVDRDYGDRKADFISCVAWRTTAEFICRNFHKGSMAAVTGRLQVSSWEAKDGTKRTTTEVIAENIYFGGSKREEGEQQPTRPIEINTDSGWEADETELPF